MCFQADAMVDIVGRRKNCYVGQVAFTYESSDANSTLVNSRCLLHY